MKAFVEIVLIWGIVLALVLAAFLLNFWLVHHIELLVGAKATWYIIACDRQSGGQKETDFFNCTALLLHGHQAVLRWQGYPMHSRIL